MSKRYAPTVDARGDVGAHRVVRGDGRRARERRFDNTINQGQNWPIVSL